VPEQTGGDKDTDVEIETEGKKIDLLLSGNKEKDEPAKSIFSLLNGIPVKFVFDFLLSLFSTNLTEA
jgi:hypothetical protein